MESILTSVKKALGIEEEHEFFDKDLVMHINTVFSILTQMGVGHSASFRITDKSQTWDEFLKNDLSIEDVKTYVALKVKLIFDPPASSSTLASLERVISELEWRLHVECDSSNVDSDCCYIIDWGDN